MLICRFRSVVIITLLVLLGGCAASPPRQPDNVCSIFDEKRAWYKEARQAEGKWGVSMHIPLAFMYQESAFVAKARPPRGRLLWVIPWRRPTTAYGYAQALNGTWRDYIDATGQYWRKRHDFGDANDFINWYIVEASRRNGVSLDDAYSLYLNYHEGPGGFARGSHHHKAWLIKAATAVQQRSQRYRQQYIGCQEELDKGFWARLFGR